jgi:hypothetical protein
MASEKHTLFKLASGVLLLASLPAVGGYFVLRFADVMFPRPLSPTQLVNRDRQIASCNPR